VRLIVEKRAKNHAAAFTGNTLWLDPDIVARVLFFGTDQFANNGHLLKLLPHNREKARPRRGPRRTYLQSHPRPYAPGDSLPHPSPLTSVLNSCHAMGEDENWRRRGSI